MNAATSYEPVSNATAMWRAARAIAWRHLYKWVSVPANFIPTFLFPLVFFTAFAGGLGRVQDIPGFDYPAGYTSFIFIFSLIQTCTFGGLATGFTIAGDFESGFAQRLMLCVRSRFAILFGYLLSTFLRALFMCVVVTAVAKLVGMRVLGDPAELAALYALALGMSFVGTLWASGVMFRGRSAQIAPAMQMPMFVAIFLTPVYVPIELLGGWIEVVAQANPISYVMETMRGLLGGYADRPWLAVVCIGGLVTVLSAWAVRGVRSAERAGGASGA